MAVRMSSIEQRIASDDSRDAKCTSRYTIFPFTDATYPKKIPARSNFISFLAVSQCLEIPLLPITWDPARQPVGLGQSGHISEASMSLYSSFAFKRIGHQDKLDNPQTEIFGPLINEVAVLRHKHIERHPNVPELEGVCWEIVSSTASPSRDMRDPGGVIPVNVWPVLVFEKSQHGDLYQFSQSQDGHNLSVGDRLTLCMDIGNAVATMHDNHLIHGDLKPQNVLIFDAEISGVVIAKVIDFGFSPWYESATSSLILPGSWPWYAPEWNEMPTFNEAQAQKAEVYSFGLLCLWFLFEPSISGLLKQPKDFHPFSRYIQAIQGHRSATAIIGALKDMQLLAELADDLLLRETSISDELRHVNVKDSLHFLDVEEAKRQNTPAANYLAYADCMRRQTGKTIPAVQMPPASDTDFDICKSLHFLYSSDFRVRVHIVECLQNIVNNDPDSVFFLHQLALCRKLCFGGISPILSGHSDVQNELWGTTIDTDIEVETQRALKYISSLEKDEFKIAGTFYMLAETDGLSQDMTVVDPYHRDGILPAANAALRIELAQIEEAIGKHHWISLQLMLELSMVLNAQGKASEAESLEDDLVTRSTLALGRQHPDTIHCLSMLISRYMNDGRLDKAEELSTEIVEACVNIYTKDHPITMARTATLGWIYARQGRLKQAEDKYRDVISRYYSDQKMESPSELRDMEHLALIYAKQHKFQDAEAVLLRVISSKDITFGRSDTRAISTRRYLASLYRQQGRETEADALLADR
ncbi:hypothetical protein F5Y16DRAFT_416667 [Xylariaceae sp. FL0255]|nr:hypothetical protein F5Y16DRAFT_416667 [Xylariaceae sp. FL0255]